MIFLKEKGIWLKGNKRIWADSWVPLGSGLAHRGPHPLGFGSGFGWSGATHALTRW